MPGLIPSDQVPEPFTSPKLKFVQGDHMDAFYAPSFMCPGAGGGLFVRTSVAVGPGYLIGTYYGPDNVTMNMPYLTACKAWELSSYVLANATHRYVVDGAESCGAAMANEGFTKINSIYWFDPMAKCIQIRTFGTLLANSVYEILTNYDTPSCVPSFWSPERVAQLPRQAQRECAKVYVLTGNNYKFLGLE